MAAYTTITRTISLLLILGGISLGVQHNDTLGQRIMDEWQLDPHMAVRDADYDLSKLLASMEKRVMIGTFGTDASQLEHDLEVLRYQLALTQTDAYRVRFEDIPEALNVLDDTSRDVEQFHSDILSLRPGDVDAFAMLQDQLLVHRDALTKLVDHSKDWSQRRVASLKRERTQWTMIQYGLLGCAALLCLWGLRRKAPSANPQQYQANMSDTQALVGAVVSLPILESAQEQPSPKNRKSLFGQSRTEVPSTARLAPTISPVVQGPEPYVAEPQPVRMNIADVIDDMMRIMAPWAAQRHITLACTIDPDIPHHVMASTSQIVQILRHLVGNAIKFTQQGGIVLAVDMTAPHAHLNAALRFSVLDTGIGIEPGYRDLIFGQQVQVDPDQAVDFSAFDPEQRGLGNGLAIVRQMVTALGGQVGLDSKPGLGSKFWFTMPIEAPDQCIGADIDARHHHILVVDSDMVRSEAVADQCQAFGADVMIAEHAFAAIEAIMLRQREQMGQQGAYDLMVIAAPHGIQPLMPLLRQISQLEAAPRHIAIATPQENQQPSLQIDDLWGADSHQACHILSLPIYGVELIGLLAAICTTHQQPQELRA